MDCDESGNCIIKRATTEILSTQTQNFKSILISISAEENSELTNFGKKSFSEFTKLSLVNLTNCKNLNAIDEDVFYLCNHLSTVILPKEGKLETIMGGAFYGTAIQSIKFPQSLKYLRNRELKYGAFCECRQLQKVEFYSENNLEEVEVFVFRRTSLITFDIGPKLNYIVAGSFETCDHTFKSITISKGNEYFSEYCGILYNSNFSNLIYCPCGLSNVTLHENVETINGEAFQNHIVTDCVFLTNKTKTLSNHSFCNCVNMKRIFLPDSLTYIGGNCFLYCYKLESLTIPHGVSQLESNFIDSCTSLRMLVLYDTVMFISDYAFSGCNNIQKCGILCSLEMKKLIQKYFYFPDSAFQQCSIPEITYTPNKYNIKITFLFIIFLRK